MRLTVEPYDYCARIGCAPGVFAAVMETLGYEDDPVVDDVWKATVGLVGGTGNMAIGTCGAMAGAAMAISYSFGFTKKDRARSRFPKRIFPFFRIIARAPCCIILSS